MVNERKDRCAGDSGKTYPQSFSERSIEQATEEHLLAQWGYQHGR
jgi:hypothetical protein